MAALDALMRHRSEQHPSETAKAACTYHEQIRGPRLLDERCRRMVSADGDDLRTGTIDAFERIVDEPFQLLLGPHLGLTVAAESVMPRGIRFDRAHDARGWTRRQADEVIGQRSVGWVVHEHRVDGSVAERGLFDRSPQRPARVVGAVDAYHDSGHRCLSLGPRILAHDNPARQVIALGASASAYTTPDNICSPRNGGEQWQVT